VRLWKRGERIIFNLILNPNFKLNFKPKAPKNREALGDHKTMTQRTKDIIGWLATVIGAAMVICSITGMVIANI
jgi:hypothetical protein